MKGLQYNHDNGYYSQNGWGMPRGIILDKAWGRPYEIVTVNSFARLETPTIALVLL